MTNADVTNIAAPALDELWAKTVALLRGRRRPESTYRLQFHAGFTFRDAAAIVDYVQALGVTHCYASPFLKACPGSTHGYDIVDHGCLNPEVGSEDDYRAFVQTLQDHELGQLLDIVPNHMGVASHDNQMWNDVLENGPASRFAGFFDIAWRASWRPELHDKVLIPALGEPYGDVLEAGQLQLQFAGGVFSVRYLDRKFPISPQTYGMVLGHGLEALERDLGPEHEALLEYQSILTATRNLPDRTRLEPDKILELAREKEVIKRRLAALVERDDRVRRFIDDKLSQWNGTPGQRHSFDLLHDLLDQQCYRLSYWRVAPDEINYRRFFDINDLAAVNMESAEVFDAAHALVLKLAAEGAVDGFRIDHPDGLYDPDQYFSRLQRRFVLACARTVADAEPAFDPSTWGDLERQLTERLHDATAWAQLSGGKPLYVVAEKILGADETLIESWAVHGTSGYDFLNMTNGLFVDAAGETALTRFYRDLAPDVPPFGELAYREKIRIMQVALASELHMLAAQLDRLAQKSRRSRDFTFNTLRRALREIIACFPVYRSYIGDDGVHDADRRYVEIAVRRALNRSPLVSRRLFRFIRAMLLQEAPDTFNETDRAELRRFAGKFQQVTAPVTAKGIEDTAFYVYHRLISLNEVGGDPGRFGVSPAALHRYFAARQAKWPLALSPLSTHDTKRSEDVRARLNVLSEIPDEWRGAVERWTRLNAGLHKNVDDLTVPDVNEEYLFYQTLIGAWPLEPYSAEDYATFVQRIQAYMEKALHEAKVHTSWINPNPDYDKAVGDFVAKVLDEETNRPFLEDFRVLQRRVSRYGLYNSLAQTVLKLTAPGVPDTYQGTELWDFSLVDPDNRRPVDYARRRLMLAELQAAERADGSLRDLAGEMLRNPADGRIKLFLTYRILHCRRENPGLFTRGDYIPLASAGAKANHIFAFMRRGSDLQALVATPRLWTQLMPDPSDPVVPASWGDARLLLPGMDTTLVWHNILTGESVQLSEAEGDPALLIRDLFTVLPFAVLVSQTKQ